jgi:multiple sugar transport system ATP-binding protein
MADVELKSLCKSYGETKVLHGIDLKIKSGEFVVFVGPSGCGKSTTLRMIAGLEEISDGEILIDQKTVNDVPPKDRDIAMVFQNYALYPHMSVFENMAFGLRLRKFSEDEINQRVEEAAELLGIKEYLQRRPSDLSGGQRQRVAMGRAIVRRPKVFLFDEPLSNLDAKLRNTMRAEIKKLHSKLKTTIVYVTHDQVEAMTLADRMVLMNKGKIEQAGPPLDLFHKPATTFVAEFLGNPPMNLMSYKMKDLISLSNIPKLSEQEELKVGFRPEAVALEAKEAGLCVSGTLELIEPLGGEALLHLRHDSGIVLGKVKQIRSHFSFGQGDKIQFFVPEKHLYFFDKNNNRL